MMEQKQKSGILQILRSVFASMIGIQSEKNRQQDFAGGSPATYIAVGLIATVLLVLAIYTVVSLVVGR